MILSAGHNRTSQLLAFCYCSENMFSLTRVHSSREKMRCLGNKKIFFSARTASMDFSVSVRLVNSSAGLMTALQACESFR